MRWLEASGPQLLLAQHAGAEAPHRVRLNERPPHVVNRSFITQHAPSSRSAQLQLHARQLTTRQVAHRLRSKMEAPKPAAPEQRLRMQFMSDLHIEFARVRKSCLRSPLILKFRPSSCCQSGLLVLLLLPYLEILARCRRRSILALLKLNPSYSSRSWSYLAITSTFCVLTSMLIYRYYHCETYDTLIAETREKFKHLSNVTLMQKTAMTLDGVVVLGMFMLISTVYKTRHDSVVACSRRRCQCG